MESADESTAHEITRYPTLIFMLPYIISSHDRESM